MYWSRALQAHRGELQPGWRRPTPPLRIEVRTAGGLDRHSTSSCGSDWLLTLWVCQSSSTFLNRATAAGRASGSIPVGERLFVEVVAQLLNALPEQRIDVRFRGIHVGRADDAERLVRRPSRHPTASAWPPRPDRRGPGTGGRGKGGGGSMIDTRSWAGCGLCRAPLVVAAAGFEPVVAFFGDEGFVLEIEIVGEKGRGRDNAQKTGRAEHDRQPAPDARGRGQGAPPRNPSRVRPTLGGFIIAAEYPNWK